MGEWRAFGCDEGGEDEAKGDGSLGCDWAWRTAAVVAAVSGRIDIDVPVAEADSDGDVDANGEDGRTNCGGEDADDDDGDCGNVACTGDRCALDGRRMSSKYSIALALALA